MDVSVNFAHPVACYDNFVNKCVGRFCHVEVSLKVDIALLRFLLDTNLDRAFSPEICQNVLNQTETMSGEVVVAFYILFGGIYSLRFLNEDDEDFYKPPAAPVYECVTLPVEDPNELIAWNIRHLGRPYDIPRALLVMTPFSFPNKEAPEKFFCSQIVPYMLSENNVATTEDDIDHMKPDAVYEWLKCL